MKAKPVIEKHGMILYKTLCIRIYIYIPCQRSSFYQNCERETERKTNKTVKSSSEITFVKVSNPALLAKVLFLQSKESDYIQ